MSEQELCHCGKPAVGFCPICFDEWMRDCTHDHDPEMYCIDCLDKHIIEAHDCPTMTIRREGRSYRVVAGDRWADGLAPDEALGEVARFLLNGQKEQGYMRTREEREAWYALTRKAPANRIKRKREAAQQ